MIDYDYIFLIIYTLSCSIQIILYYFFLTQYLEPKHKYKSFIQTLIFLLIYMIIILTSVYDNLPLKLILTILSIEILSFLLYDGPLFKKISAAMIIFLGNAFADFISQIILIFIFQQQIFNNVPYDILIFILFFCNIFIFMEYKAILYFFQHKFASSLKFSQLFTNMTLLLFSTMVIISQSFYFNDLLLISHQRKI